MRSRGAWTGRWSQRFRPTQVLYRAVTSASSDARGELKSAVARARASDGHGSADKAHLQFGSWPPNVTAGPEGRVVLARAFASRSHRRQGGTLCDGCRSRAALAREPVLPVRSIRSTGKNRPLLSGATGRHKRFPRTVSRLRFTRGQGSRSASRCLKPSRQPTPASTVPG